MTERVDFYVLAGSDARARLKLACRIAEKAYLADQQVLVNFDAAELQQNFDELLWTFADRSFVPHESYDDARRWQQAPVLLGLDARPSQPFDLLLNLAAGVPAAADTARRVIEIVDADEQRRQLGRARFRHYREHGLTPQTHTLTGDDAP